MVQYEAFAAALLLCDRVAANESTGVTDLGGIFFELESQQFPFQREFSLWTHLIWNYTDKAKLTVLCREEGSNWFTNLVRDHPFSFEGHGQKSVAFHIDWFRFPRPNRYYFYLKCDGEIIITHSIVVREKSPSQ